MPHKGGQCLKCYSFCGEPGPKCMAVRVEAVLWYSGVFMQLVKRMS